LLSGREDEEESKGRSSGGGGREKQPDKNDSEGDRPEREACARGAENEKNMGVFRDTVVTTETISNGKTSGDDWEQRRNLKKSKAG